MKTNFRRIFSLILALAMAISLLPAGLIGASAENGREANVPTVFTAEDYAIIDALFEKIEAMENAPAKKNSTQTQLTDAAEAIVLASDNYLEGSLDRNGDFFSWMTDEGIRCCYNPRMRKIRKEMNAPETPEPSGAFNEPVFTKGGWPTSSEVYLIAPYYGIDESFTDQYKHEAEDIAEAIGDTSGYTLYSGSAATVDKVADAVSNGAVVIFDSHGSTDYYDPENELDYVTGATSSYLCLSTMDGLTDEDYADGAMYSLEGDAFVNGAVIANHMSKNSPSGLLWMAICLGMATDTLCEPMRSKGVEVVYGYSQSVSFGGEYLFEEVFWDEMIAGKTVAQSIASMKSVWGNWDWSTEIAAYYGYDDGYATISDARADYIAFPIVVSDEDTHPGQRKGSSYGADILQTVNSTYTLYSQYNVTATSNNTAYGTVSLSGNKITATPETGYYAAGYTVIEGSANVTQNGNTFTVNALSDCTVQINFAAKTPLTVTFYENGTVGSTIQTYSGDPLTLPDHQTTVPTNYKFLGWVERTVNNVTDKPDVLAVGSEQTAKA
ncbi:MAG: hypothetical protein IIX68_03050, partial [Clostridia bacterium]|nr:hypothetical protein [Clostridia bacterium]